MVKLARGIQLALLGVLLFGWSLGTCYAQPREQEYQLGVGDILQLNVLQQPGLDRTLTIRPDGNAVIPRVGEVQLESLTLLEAEELVRQRLRLFDPSIGDVSLTVTEYNALRIYVLGEVSSPGSYTFNSPPGLWDVIRAAGGPSGGANLSVVRVIHQVDGTTTTETYDASPLVSGQGIMPAIRLHSGDTVVVSGGEGGIMVPADIGVQVIGAVGVPQTVALSEPTRLLSVLMMAGTPLETGELHKVWWVHREGQSSYRSTRVNVKLFLEEGSLAGNPLVYPGDTIRVPQRGLGWFREFLPFVLSTATAASAILLTIDRLQN